MKQFISPLLKYFSSAAQPFIYSSLYKQEKQLKLQINELIIEKNKISPQDQYAKWTKLNRSIEKNEKELSSLKVQISNNLNNLDKFIKNSSLLLTLSIFITRIYFRNEKIYFIPLNFVPKLVEIILSLNLLHLVKNLLHFKLEFNDVGFITINNCCFLLDSFISNLKFIALNINKNDLKKPEKPKSKVEEVN